MFPQRNQRLLCRRAAKPKLPADGALVTDLGTETRVMEIHIDQRGTSLLFICFLFLSFLTLILFYTWTQAFFMSMKEVPCSFCARTDNSKRMLANSPWLICQVFTAPEHSVLPILASTSKSFWHFLPSFLFFSPFPAARMEIYIYFLLVGNH